MPKLTESECIKYGGKVEVVSGPPTWEGKKLKICRIPAENVPPEIRRRFKGWYWDHGTRVIIIGPE